MQTILSLSSLDLWRLLPLISHWPQGHKSRQTYFWSQFNFKQRNQHDQCEKWDQNQKSHSPRVSLSQVLWHWSYICSSQMYFWQLMILMMTHLLVMPAGWPYLYPWMTPYLQYWIQTLSQGHGFSRSLSPSHNVSQDSSFQNSLPPDFEFLLPLRHQILSVFCQKEHWRGWFTLGQHSDFFQFPPAHLSYCWKLWFSNLSVISSIN